MAHYEAAAGPLALAAARRALDASGVDPATITHLITVSCTGFAAPGFDLALIEGLGLNRGVARTHVGFMGCHGALNGLRVARAFADGRAGEPGPRLRDRAVQPPLPLRLGCRPGGLERPVRRRRGGGRRASTERSPAWAATGDPWRLVASGSTVMPATGDAMSWRIGDHGFAMTLSPQVARHINEHLRPWLASWLDRQGLDLGDVGSWAVHPGGPQILDAVQEALGLGPEALATSREVLAECGNMSSPTVLFILDRLRRRRPRGRAWRSGSAPAW